MFSFFFHPWGKLCFFDATNLRIPESKGAILQLIPLTNLHDCFQEIASKKKSISPH
jgi:hypothetical protein